MTTSRDLICGICDRIKAAHGGLNHEFSPSGALIPLKTEKPKLITNPVAADVVLRLLLVEKGVIDSEDITRMETMIREQLTQARRDASDSLDTGAPDGNYSDRP